MPLFPCLLLLAASLASAAPRSGSPEVEVRYWSTPQGLPDASISSIQQTPEGFLWVGTGKGLVRFDGWSFARVELRKEGGTPINTAAQITAQCLDSKKQLWFGTEENGVFRLDPASGSGLAAEQMGLAGEKVFCLGADAESVVWVGTERGLLKWDGAEFRRVPQPEQANPAVLALQVTRSNGVWVTTHAGLRKYQHGEIHRGEFDPAASGEKAAFVGVFEDRQGSLWGFGDTYLLNLRDNRRFNYFRGGGATQLDVWSICEGRSGQLWIGTSGQGLFYFSGGRFHAVDLREGRDYLDIRAVFLDREGHLWVGTQRGLLQLRERVVRWFTGPGSAATCLAEDPEGTVWAGFEHGGLLCGSGGMLEAAPNAGELGSQNLLTSISSRRDGGLWAGTLGSGLLRMREGRVVRFTTAHGLTANDVVAVCGAGSNRLWVATGDGRLHRWANQLEASFGREQGLTANPITAILVAREGGVWLGTTEGELLRFRNGTFHLQPQNPKFAGKPISALCETGPNRLWVGTRGAGLASLDKGTWTQMDPLPHAHVLGIESPGGGELWFASTRGIWRMSQKPAGSTPPMLMVEFPGGSQEPAMTGWPRSLRARDGTFWFATDQGVVSFHPADLKVVRSAPVVRLESIRANGVSQEGFLAELVSTSQRLSKSRWPGHASDFHLPANLRDLEFSFTTPSLSFPERTHFRHRLDGFDADWQDSTATRKGRYGKLAPGEYCFRVCASSEDGEWNGPETQLNFVVPTPLWRHPVALGLQTLLLIAAVALLARIVSHRRLRRQLVRLEQQRAMERERSRIARDMHDELGAKLTKISFLSERARNDLASGSSSSSKLDSIATTSRDLLHSLDEIVWAVNPRNDSLENLAAYLGQYAAEYLENTSVEHEIRMPGALPDVPLSAEARHNLFLAFKEALGNALKHSGATRIQIAMTMVEHKFAIEITDNGRGFAPAGAAAPPPGRRQGSGLRGMRERLSRTGGSCEIESKAGQGTKVVLQLPLVNGNQHAP